jgi:hypothetical protein
MRQIDISSVPDWRKIVLIVGVCATISIGFLVFTREQSIYASAARTPNSATAETSPVSVNHGSIRYLTRKKQDNLAFWRAFVGVPLLPGLLLLATSREFWRAVNNASS